MNSSLTLEQIHNLHALYCRLTGQNLSMGFERQRLWFELLRLGYGPQQLQQVIGYLQREIRAQRRNVGALKLSNLLQPDRFEEDLNISKVRLHKPPSPTVQQPVHTSAIDPSVQQLGRQKALHCIQKLKQELHIPPRTQSENNPTPSPEKMSLSNTEQFGKSPAN